MADDKNHPIALAWRANNPLSPHPISARGAMRSFELPSAMAAGVSFAVLPRLGCFAADQLVEIALLAARGLLLVQQGEAGLIEFLEKFLPGNLLERLVLGVRRAGKFDADDAGIILAVGCAHRCRASAARLCPFANLVVIGGDFRFGHALPPLSHCKVNGASAKQVQAVKRVGEGACMMRGHAEFQCPACGTAYP